MELTARYGLEFNPFLKNSKEILFEGTEYTEAKFRLDYLAKTKGFGLSYRGSRTWENNSGPFLVCWAESIPVQGDLYQPLYRYGE